MGLKSYSELKNLDLSKYIKKRDNADYINWATIVDLLHENGAAVVYFEPVVNEITGSSLFMTEQVFTDSKGNTNRVYETAVKIVIDDLEFIQRGPVSNGANPVKDNSMSQQRLWNCQCRLFVKGVAIRTGLGFGLWQKEEINDEVNDVYDDLNKHDLFKIKERVQELYTKIHKQGFSTKEIAERLHKTEDEIKAIFSYFDTISNFEKDLYNFDTNQDRSGYIGASDTSIVVGNWNTKTFEKWWLEKIGIYKNNLSNEAIKAGNNYEHKILDALEIEGLEKDKQIIIDRLRVNLDGNTDTCIYEVKTHNAEKEFKVSKQYWRQAQVEMYASGIKKLYIVAYGLVEKDYTNYFNEIDKGRIEMFEVEYDEKFIINEYLPRLKYLTKCLKRENSLEWRKFMDSKCSKCGSEKLFVEEQGNRRGLYCGECGKWQKWITKQELQICKFKGVKIIKENRGILYEITR